jgi:hypothetical protein
VRALFATHERACVNQSTDAYAATPATCACIPYNDGVRKYSWRTCGSLRERSSAAGPHRTHVTKGPDES